MNARQLIDTAKKMVASDKGLLAMGESNPTCNKRFDKLGIPQPALEIWHGEMSNVAAAQKALYRRAECNQAAPRGTYDVAMETEDSGRASQSGSPVKVLVRAQ